MTFLEIEVNEFVKNQLLDRIIHLEATDKDESRFDFNVYSLVINKGENKIILTNDIEPDGPQSTLSIEEFRSVLLKFNPKLNPEINNAT